MKRCSIFAVIVVSLSLLLNGIPSGEALANVAIDIRKQAEGPDTRTFPSGSDVDFEIVVTNTGSEDLENVVVTDTLVPGCDFPIGDLAAGVSITYTCTAPNVTASFDNEACVTGERNSVKWEDCDPSSIIAGNNAPVANDDAYTAARNIPLTVPAVGVLANDVDVDGDTLSVSSFSPTSTEGGSVAINSDGSFTYTPPLNFISGTGPPILDTFTYVADDGNGAQATGTVFITVLVADSDGDLLPDDEDPDTIADVVGDPSVIPDSSFSDMGGGHRTAMLASLNAIETKIAEGKINKAIKELEKLRERVDGCDGSATESPDGNDWITNCDDQRLIRGLIDGMLARLESL